MRLLVKLDLGDFATLSATRPTDQWNTTHTGKHSATQLANNLAYDLEIG
jgi:hypothetical protein